MATACETAKQNLKTTLTEQCARDADDLVQELTAKHETLRDEALEGLTEQQRADAKALNTSLVRKC